MGLTATKILLLLAGVGHLLLWHCDRMLTYLDGGRFDFKMLSDNQKLSAVMGNTPLDKPMRSGIGGVMAMAAMLPGYLALSEWMRPFSGVCAALMTAGEMLFFVPGGAHHVLCGVVEWVYIRMGKTDEARRLIAELFKKSSSTMVVCYAGLLMFSLALFAAVVGGLTTLPRWACVFNPLLYIVLFPLRIVGTGNIVCAVTMLALGLLL